MGQVQLQRELVKRTLAGLDSAKAGKELKVLLETECRWEESMSCSVRLAHLTRPMLLCVHAAN